MFGLTKVFSWIGVVFSVLALFGLVGEVGYDPDAAYGILVALLWGTQSVMTIVLLNEE